MTVERTGGATEGRSPSGERGLKFAERGGFQLLYQSLPIRGAWIEMSTHWSMAPSEPVAPHPGSVD